MPKLVCLSFLLPKCSAIPNGAANNQEELMRPGMFRLAGRFLFVTQAQQGSGCFDRSGVDFASMALASWQVQEQSLKPLPGFVTQSSTACQVVELHCSEIYIRCNPKFAITVLGSLLRHQANSFGAQ